MTNGVRETTSAGASARPGAELLDRARHIAVEIAARHAGDVDLNARFPHEALAALKHDRLLSAAVPRELGGAGLSVGQLSAICEALGQHCASTAMIYAMHVIQVACIVRHGKGSAFFAQYLMELVERQSLIASATSEAGVGGEMRTSVAAVERRAGRLFVEKEATTISYGAHADALLLTARSSPSGPPNDQVLVLLQKTDYALDKPGSWNTLGMRGTCSPGFRVRATALEEQILPVPFGDIANETMVPFAHILWSSCWVGIARAALARARAFVRLQARATPGTVPPSALRLAEASNLLEVMRMTVREAASECEGLMRNNVGTEALSSISFALKINNLKVSSAELVVQIVHKALLICGIAGYNNESSFAIGRHLRDAHSAALMVSNDRIYATNASLLLVLKDD